MTLLSTELIKKTYVIPARQLCSSSTYYIRGPGIGGSVSYTIPQQTFGNTVGTYDTLNSKSLGTQLCWAGGFYYYGSGPMHEMTFGRYCKYNWGIEYKMDTMIADLIALYPPATHTILSITHSGAFENRLAAGNLMLHYGNPGALPKVTVIKGEGKNITVSDETLGMKDYFKRIIDDMYDGKITSPSIFANQGNACSPICDPTNQLCCSPIYNPVSGPSPYNHVCEVEPLTLIVYVVPKSTDLHFTLKDAVTPVDDTVVTPETEITDEEVTVEDPGLTEEYGRDYGVIGDSGGVSNTEVVPPAEFDYIYIPNTIPITSLDGVVIGVGIVAGHVEDAGLTHTNVYIKSITNAFKGADTMTIVEHVKYSEAGIFNIGDKVLGLIYGETRFLGWIKVKNRVITESEQYIQYEAVGVKEFLDQIPFSAHYRITNSSIAYIFANISQYVPKSLVATLTGLSLLPNSLLPEFTVDSSSFGHALDSIIDYARKYNYYIDYSKELTVYNLDSLPVVQLTMPTEGAALSAIHLIKSKNLSVDVSNCRTRCILRGDYPIVEYDEVRDVSWTIVNNQWVGEIDLGKRLMSNLLSNTSIPVYVYFKSSTGAITAFTVSYVNCNTGLVKVIDANAFWRKNELRIRYCVKDELHPLKYDSGWKGTAYTDYNIQQVLVQQDTRFRQVILPEGVIRDDSAKMSDYANNLLDSLKNWKIGGSIVVDGLDLTLVIGKSVEILNSGCAELASKYLAIMSITWDFENHTTSLNLTNDYYLGTSIIDPINDEKYDERKLIEQVITSRGKIQDFPWVFNQ